MSTAIMTKPTLMQNILGRPSRRYAYSYPVPPPVPVPSFSPPPPEQDVWEVVVGGRATEQPVTQPVRKERVEAQQTHSADEDEDEEDDQFFTPAGSLQTSPRESAILDDVRGTLFADAQSVSPQPATNVVKFPSRLEEKKGKPIEHIRPQNTDRMPSDTTTTTTGTKATTITTQTAATTATSHSRTSSEAYTDFSFNAGRSSTSRTTPIGTLSRSNSSSSQPLKPGPPTRTSKAKGRIQETEKEKEKEAVSHDWSKDVRWLVSPEEMERQAHAKETAKARAKAHRLKEKEKERETGSRERSRERSSVQGAGTTKSSASGSVDSGSTITTARRSGRSTGSSRTAPPTFPAPSQLPPDILSLPLAFAHPHAHTDPPQPQLPTAAQHPPMASAARTRRASVSLVQPLHRMSDVPEMEEGEIKMTMEEIQPLQPLHKVERQPSLGQTLNRSRTSSLPSPAARLSADTVSSHPPSRSGSALESTSRSRASRAYTTTSSTHRTVVLPTPMPVLAPTSSSFQQGYTSLTLPLAGYVPSTNPERDAIEGKVDVARMGIGQASMATVSVIRGAAGESVGLWRTRTLSLGRQRSRSEDGSRSSFEQVSRTVSRKSQTSGLAFSVRTAPPARVTPNSVLVRVHACALDKLDVLMLREKGEYGYIPGRSFVGTAVEAGWGCEHIGKGNWVWGLLDARKPGALAEFILVDKRHVTLCPHPSPMLSIAQLAILPLAGVPAHRAARTASTLSPGSRVLVLLGSARDGGAGQGVLATREMVAMGLEVVVQVDGDNEDWADGVARACEADAVFTGTALECLDSVSSSEQAKFDLVLDCVGGPNIWRAVRRGGVIRSDSVYGGFTTLVGDRPDDPPTLGAQIRSNLRSLRRAFLAPGSASQQDARDHLSNADGRQPGDKGDGHVSRIEYEWISPLHVVDREGEDIMDTLTAVSDLARQGVLVPSLTMQNTADARGGWGASGPLDGVRVVLMEKAAEAIEGLGDGGVVVVKVIS